MSEISEQQDEFNEEVSEAIGWALSHSNELLAQGYNIFSDGVMEVAEQMVNFGNPASMLDNVQSMPIMQENEAAMPTKVKAANPKPTKKEATVKTANELIVTDEMRINARDRTLEAGDGIVGKKIHHMIKSRFRILYIRSHEERRVRSFFRDLTMYGGQELFQWDCDRGLVDGYNGERISSDQSEINEGDPTAILSHIIDHASKHSKPMHEGKIPAGAIYMLLDFHHFLDGFPPVERKLKEFVEVVSTCTIVIISPVFVCPPTLEKEITLIDFPVPSYKEINSSLQKLAKEISTQLPEAAKEAKANEEDLVKSASGLTLNEAENAYAMSVVCDKRFNIQTILDEKKQMIRKGGILEYRDSRFTFDDLGGVDTLKNWLSLRRLAFKDDARDFGLPAPKGVLIIGIPGTGKSMTCDALASAYEMPLLRLDFGAVFSAHVGESEQNIRLCLQTAEAIAPCILWIDEVEKGIGGVESSNATDGGVTSRVFGTMLTWMQDKISPVFVVCTANNITGIPPEFMRAGRFDEIFFIDLPDEDQRAEVIHKLLQRKNRDPSQFDIDAVVLASERYTPVEIEKGIDNALFVAYAENKRDVTTADIVSEIKKFYPLYNSRREDIDAMREWALGESGAGGRAILANSPKVVISKNADNEQRLIDIDNDLDGL